MRLKQLEVTGLKSFANKTVLDFDPGVTGIVGPNGCGKSNVVDSIRWVLGEQSARHLRGDSMEDVIFKGNERVPAAGMAQVSLTFENDPEKDGPITQVDDELDVSTLPAHFRNLTEITVTRRYFRSGESEYYINKTPCRLKDITELFLGTGVGSRAYAIIEQGRVEQLINAKPEDRRLFIEEAAGTTLFRSRKLAAERKIERTRENLLRVNDVLQELDRQIQYLHRMAKRAEQYRSMQAEVRDLDLRLGALQARTLTEAIDKDESRVGELRQEDEQIVSRAAQLEQDLDAQRRAQATSEEQLAGLRESVATLVAEAQSLEQRSNMLQREIADRERRATRLGEESQALVARRSELEVELEQLRKDVEVSARELEEAQQALAGEEQALAESRKSSAAIQAEIEALRGRTVGLASAEAEARNQRASRLRRGEELTRQAERLARQHLGVEEHLAAAEHAAAARTAAIDVDRRELANAEDEKRTRAENVRVLAERRRHATADLEQLTQDLGKARSQLESLQSLRQSYEGYRRGVRSLLLAETRSPSILGVVGELVSAPAQYERALAAVLGDRLQYVVVTDGQAAIDAVATLRESSGRGSFIPTQPRGWPVEHFDGFGDTSIVRLLDVIHVDPSFRAVADALLGDVFLASDLQGALALWQASSRRATFVTPDGEVVDPQGVITGGNETLVEEEIVSRQRLIGELEAEAERLATRRAEVDADLQSCVVQLDAEQAALAGLDRNTHALALRLVANEKDLDRVRGRAARLTQERGTVVAELKSATAEIESLGHDAATLEARLTQLTAESEALRSTLAERQATSATLTQTAEEVRARVTQLQVRLAETRQRHETARTNSERLTRELDAAGRRSEDLAAEEQLVAGEVEGLRTDLGQAGEDLEQRRERTAVLRTQIADLQAVLATQSEEVATRDAELRASRASLDEVRRSLNHHEVSLTEARMRLEHLVTAIRERYEQDLDGQVPFEGTAEEEAEARTRADALRTRMLRLGEVNVGAIDELRELEERAGFLRTQKADLEQSIADLERTIQKLNRASKTRFAETFESVNQKFQEVLPRLFRGGEARLVLTNENDLLESGVDIVVKPPGKRLDTVTLLSGGEKALVAVSLIFSLFLTNPTPFCILDEVDAPLDDANIGRFTALIKEMSAHTQFIVITHNKRTMEAAEVLYGVTMQEPGVSKVISVATR